jgi:hypothetical protein
MFVRFIEAVAVSSRTRTSSSPSTGLIAALVAAVGLTVWAGAIVARWWDLLTAWLVWGSVVLAALVWELRKPENAAAGHPEAVGSAPRRPGHAAR